MVASGTALQCILYPLVYAGRGSSILPTNAITPGKSPLLLPKPVDPERMFTKEKYCAVCGCLFSLPLIRDPEHPDPNEDSMLQYSDPYDSRVLPKELTLVWFHP